MWLCAVFQVAAVQCKCGCSSDKLADKESYSAGPNDSWQDERPVAELSLRCTASRPTGEENVIGIH